MYRILFGLAPSVVILAVFSWLVHVEGQSYRRRFQENVREQLAKRLVHGEKPPTPDQSLSPVPENDQGGLVANKSRLTPDPTLGLPAKQEQKLRSQEHTETLPPKAVETPPEPIKIVRPSPIPSLTPEPKPSATTLPKNNHWPVDPIPWKDPLRLTRDEEIKVGKAVHEVILQHHRVLSPAQEVAFRNHLQTLVIPLLEHRTRKDGEPQIFLVGSAEAFAFSHLGGYIYLSPVLARSIPEDVELEFILAHEIAHIDLRHGIEKVAKEMGAEARRQDQRGLVQRIYHQIAEGYDSEQEYAADKWACQELLKMGRSHHDIRMFLLRLQNYNARQQGVDIEKPPAGLDADIQDVEHHWQRHPAIPYRLNRLEKIME